MPKIVVVADNRFGKSCIKPSALADERLKAIAFGKAVANTDPVLQVLSKHLAITRNLFSAGPHDSIESGLFPPRIQTQKACFGTCCSQSRLFLIFRCYLIAVSFFLERARSWHADITGLFWLQLSQFDAQLSQMQASNFFIEVLW